MNIVLRLTSCLLLLTASLNCIPIIIATGVAENRNERMAVLLEESKGGDPDHAGVTGLIVDRRGVVTDTISYSPAREDGIKPDDRILEVDGLPFDVSMLPLSGLPGTQVRLLVVHDDVQRTAILTRVAWRSVMDGSWIPPGPTSTFAF